MGTSNKIERSNISSSCENASYVTKGSYGNNESKSLRQEIESTSQKEYHKIKELEQGEIISSDVVDSLTKRSTSLEKQLSDANRRSNELKQENIMLNEEIVCSQKVKRSQLRKYLLIVTVMGIAISLLVMLYSYHQSQILIDSKASLNNYKSQYVIQNLKGDTIDTWAAWDVPEDRTLNIQIDDKANLSESKIDAIKDAVLSLESIQIDDSLLHKGPKGTLSTYYRGWSGALSSIEDPASHIPTKFKILDGSDGIGDVVISLQDFKNPDGYLGWTQSKTDNNQILKSNIGIYQANDLSAEQLRIIIRHEFGHALGLAHSTAPEDLMSPVIQTDYPYISECDIDAIKTLYVEKHSSQVICTK